MALDHETALARFQTAYALERQAIDAQWESVDYWKHWEWLYWDWYYWAQFDWRAIRE